MVHIGYFVKPEYPFQDFSYGMERSAFSLQHIMKDYSNALTVCKEAGWPPIEIINSHQALVQAESF